MYKSKDANHASRLVWMDVVRGIAILLVLFYHSMTLVGASIEIPRIASGINEFLAPLRMPLLMALSGLLVAPSMAKGRGPYFRGKLQRIGWPYLVWTVLIMAVLISIASPPMKPSAIVERVLQLPYYPAAHLWYLYYLLFFYGMAWAARRTAWWLAPTMLLIISGLAQSTGSETLQSFAFLGTFFMLGAAASARPTLIARLSRPPVWAAITAAALPAGTLAAWIARTGSVRFNVFTMPLVLLMAPSVCLIGRVLADSKWSWPLARIGSNSLAYYLVHYPAMVGVAALIDKLDLRPSYLLVMSCQMIAGLAFGLALTLLARRRGFRWLLSWPPSAATNSTTGPKAPTIVLVADPATPA